VGSFIVMIPPDRIARKASNAAKDRSAGTTKHYGATGAAAVSVATGMSAAVGMIVIAAASVREAVTALAGDRPLGSGQHATSKRSKVTWAGTTTRTRSRSPSG
jgi:hypothetical protein